MLGVVPVSFVPTLLVLAAILGAIKLLYWFRASAMRALALKSVFQYRKGNAMLWFLPKNHRPCQLRFGYAAIQ
jgi:hypothetical protein